MTYQPVEAATRTVAWMAALLADPETARQVDITTQKSSPNLAHELETTVILETQGVTVTLLHTNSMSIWGSSSTHLSYGTTTFAAVSLGGGDVLGITKDGAPELLKAATRVWEERTAPQRAMLQDIIERDVTQRAARGDRGFALE